MSTKVEKNVVVDVPLSTVYNQWTQFEDFPHFMNGVQSVTQLGDDRLQWVAELGGVRRQWEAKIVEQVPDSRVSWAATEGATNAGTVTFRDAGNGRTEVHLVLEYEPEGLVEKVGDKLNVVENQAEGDLERFKKFIEAEGYATGAWRGSVNEGAPVGTPGVERGGRRSGLPRLGGADLRQHAPHQVAHALGVDDLQEQVRDRRVRVAAQDVTLQVGEIDLGSHAKASRKRRWSSAGSSARASIAKSTIRSRRARLSSTPGTVASGWAEANRLLSSWCSRIQRTKASPSLPG
jgi:carbon monoxide dehydrogenase subunit G